MGDVQHPLPDLAPEVTEAEQNKLMAMATAFAENSSALLQSRRWRIGDRLGRYFAPGLKRRRHELASERLRQLSEQFHHLVATTQVPELTHRPTLAPEPETATPEWAPWMAPKPAKYAVIVLANA